MKKRFAIFVPAAVVLAACWGLAPSRSAAGQSDWLTQVAAERTSPAARQPALTERWVGVSGKPITVAVAAPRLRAGAPVQTLGPATGDIRAAFTAAIAKLSAAGGGTLRLQPGTYRIDNPAGQPGLLIDGAKDVVIEGAGANIVFAQWGDGILIRNSARLAVRGVTIGYVRAPVVAASVVAANGRPAFRLAGAQRLPNDTSIYQVSRSDRRGPGFLTNEHRLLLGREGERAVAAGQGQVTIGNPGLSAFAGADVELKLSYYKGAAIHVLDTADSPQTHDVTIDRVTIRNSAGAGIVAGYMGRGLAIVKSAIGSSRSPADVSTIAYDGIHVTAATGDLLIRNNRITGTGDDAINLASPIYAVTRLAGAEATIAAPNPGIGGGARLALFDGDLDYVTSTTIASRRARASDGSMAVALTGPIARGGDVRYARRLDLLTNRYAVVGNRIDHCRCHGVLTQGPNGLIRDNRFFNLRANAIRVVTSAMWKEGSGAYDLTIERNRIARTGTDDRNGIVWAAVTIFADGAGGGAGGQPPILRAPMHSNIVVRNNDIADVAQGCVSVASATVVTVKGNSCRGYNRALSGSRVLVERAAPGDAMRRLPAKARYLAGGDGIWLDPLSTSAISVVAPGS